MDYGTMVEAFKHLTYSQLAKNSLVSKRFRDVIQTHRHKLALLYVKHIGMKPFPFDIADIKVFDKDLSTAEYNEWVICNAYSKQIPLQDTVAITQNVRNGYLLSANAFYKYPYHRHYSDNGTNVFFAHVQLNDDNWPVFQHFIRLTTDPFIYIQGVQLSPQNDIFSSLSRAINSDRNRLQCNVLNFNMRSNSQQFITWAKNHARCNQFYIDGKSDFSHHEALSDFFVTGGHCTPSIVVLDDDLSRATVDFLKKFNGLKNSNESQLVDAIEGNFDSLDVELFKRDHAEFIFKEERDQRSNTHIFEFVNNNIGKKLQLTAYVYDHLMSYISIKINNL